MQLSIEPHHCLITVPVKTDGTRPYDDAVGTDGLLRYRSRGRTADEANHRDNLGHREAMRRVPLIYFHGIVKGKYETEYPVFIVGDSPASLTFTVTVDERRFASLGSVAEDPVETDIRRRYVTRMVVKGLAQVAQERRQASAVRRNDLPENVLVHADERKIRYVASLELDQNVDVAFRIEIGRKRRTKNRQALDVMPVAESRDRLPVDGEIGTHDSSGSSSISSAIALAKSEKTENG